MGHLKSNWRLRCINIGSACDQGKVGSKDFFLEVLSRSLKVSRKDF